MKCYQHPKIDAVGVCSECGKGVCDKCAVEIGGKLYCKPDADKVFGEKKAAPVAPAFQAAPATASQMSAMRNSVLGMSSTAWFLAIIGLFFLPPIAGGLGLVLGYAAVSKAADNPDVFSKRDVIVCGIGAIINLALLVWWGISIVGIL